MKYLITRFQNINLKIDANYNFEGFFIKNIFFIKFKLEFTNLINLYGFNNSIQVNYLRNKINKRLRNALTYCNLSEANNFKKQLIVYYILIRNLEDTNYYYKINICFFNNNISAGNTSNSINTNTSNTNFHNTNNIAINQGSNKIDFNTINFAIFIYKDLLN